MTSSKQILFSAILSLTCIFLTPLFSKGQENENDTTEHREVEWNFEGTTNASFSDVGLSQWAAGGRSSTSLSGVLNFKKERATDINDWESRLRTGYGVTRVGDSDNPFRKTDDYIILLSKLNRDFWENFEFSGSIDFRTQMRRGYRYGPDGTQLETINMFMAPGFLVSSLGIEYSPTEQLSATLSPAASKTTFVLRDEIDPTLYGLETGDNVGNEIGGSFSLFFDYRLIENVRFENELLLFSEYEDPLPLDVNWETHLRLRVNDYISVTFGTHLIYNEDIQIPDGEDDYTAGVQFRRALQVGFNYELF